MKDKEVKNADVLSEVKKVSEELKESNANVNALHEKYDAVMDDVMALQKESGRSFGEDDAEEIEIVKDLPKDAVLKDDRTWYPAKGGFALTSEDMCRKMDDFYLLSRLLNTPIPELESFEEDSELRKALSTSGAAAWIPTGLSSELTRMIRLELKVAALFGRFNMPTNPYKLPAITAGFAPKLVAEAGTPTASDITPGDVTFDAIKLMVHGVHNYETEEDSIIPILPVIREELVYALAEALEEAVINGDDSGTHQDTDTEAGSAELVAKAFKGLRFAGLDGSYANCKVNASATFTDSVLRAGRKAMGKHGVNPDGLAYVVSIAGFFRMLSFANIMTYDKIGEMATLRNGQLAAFDGSPVIVSEKARDDVDASGVNGGSSNDFTTALIVKTGNKWLIGDRRDVLVEADKNIVTQQDTLVASQRLDFHTPYSITEKLVCVVYNIGN